MENLRLLTYKYIHFFQSKMKTKNRKKLNKIECPALNQVTDYVSIKNQLSNLFLAEFPEQHFKISSNKWEDFQTLSLISHFHAMCEKSFWCTADFYFDMDGKCTHALGYINKVSKKQYSWNNSPSNCETLADFISEFTDKWIIK